jgi:hypothetical protein
MSMYLKSMLIAMSMARSMAIAVAISAKKYQWH